MNKFMPNCFVIGAAKCGTTTLYEMLKRHPQVFSPLNKEPQFFSNDELFSKGEDFYITQFYSGADKYPVRIDYTPHYLFYRKAADRIYKVLNGNSPRFIVILRNPIDRAYSLYWNMVAEGYEKLSFEEAIEQENSRAGDRIIESEGTIRYQYLKSGLYADQLEHWMEVFPKDKFLILFYEELIDQNKILKKITRFLNVDEFTLDGKIRANTAGATRIQFIKDILRSNNALKKFIGKFIPYSAKYRLVRLVDNFNKKTVFYPPMNVSTRIKLWEYFVSDIDRLSKLTATDLSAWSPYAR